MHLSPSDTEKLLLSVAGHGRPGPARPRRAAQLPRDRRAADHLGHRTRPRGRRRRRADGVGPRRPDPRPGDGRTSPRCSPTCRSRRPSRTGASSSPSTSRSPEEAARWRHATQRTRARSGPRPGTIELNADRTRRRAHRAGHRQHRRPPGPDRLAPAPAGRQRRAGVRPRRRPRVPAGHPVRHVAAVRAGRLPRGRGRGAARATAGSPASRSRPTDAGAARWSDLDRERYAALYGPTVGDQVRLGDTDLWIEVEQDLTAGGEEAVFGGGKSIRESMAPGHHAPAPRARSDTVITNAIVLDHWGIVRADVGIRDGRIVGARPGRQPRHRRRRAPGPGDRRRPPTSSPARARSSPPAASTPTCTSSRRRRSSRPWPTGLTTLGGGGTGPSEGTKATTVTPGRLAPGSRSTAASTPSRSTCCCSARATPCPTAALRGAGARRRRRLQGARGLGLHPGRHRRGAARRPTSGACRSRCTPTRSTRPATCESTIAAIDGRSIHAFHVEGAGGGHAPDILTIAGLPNVHPGLDEPDAAAHRQHRRRAPRHADGLPPPQPARCPRTSRSPSPGSGRRPSPPRTSCTTWAPSRSPRPTRRRWAGSAR